MEKVIDYLAAKLICLEIFLSLAPNVRISRSSLMALTFYSFFSVLSVIIFLNFASLALILFFDKFSKQVHKNVPKEGKDVLPEENISTNIVTILQSKNEGDIRELIISKNIYLCQVLRMVNMKEFRVEELEERRAMNKLFLKVHFFYKIK